MKNVMLDIETLGTRPGCVILSIGAVEFDVHHGLGREFYVEISQYSSRYAGFTSDQDTMDWWDKQDQGARGVIERTGHGGEMPHQAFRKFNEWLPEDPLVWGNGAAFDNAILIEAYARSGIKPAWSFLQDRCYRTLKNLFPRIEVPRKGIHHHALHDARYQAEHAIRLLYQITETQPLDMNALMDLRRLARY